MVTLELLIQKAAEEKNNMFWRYGGQKTMYIIPSNGLFVNKIKIVEA